MVLFSNYQTIYCKKKMSNNIAKRISFLMDYNPLEKQIYSEQVDDENKSISTYDRYKKHIKDPKTIYPNYCKYPTKAVLPTKNPKGASGEDALIKNTCMYLTPSVNSKNGGTTGFFVRNDATILFWDEPSISEWAETLSKKYKVISPEITYGRLSKILPIDSIRVIKQDGKIYNSRVSKTFNQSGNNYGEWMFKGFFTKDNEVYKQPKWVETRNEVQQFIDEWGIWIQVGAAIGTAILGVVTGGATWVLALEAALEGTIGVTIAIRDFQKGDDIGGVFNLLFGFIPIAKYIPSLRGVSSQTLKTLGESFKKSGLTSKSSVDKYIKFFEELSEPEKEVLTKLLKYDEYSKGSLTKTLNLAIKEETPKLIIKQFEKLIIENPGIVKKISFWERLWAREASVVTLGLVLNIILKKTIGSELSPEELEKLSGVWMILPDNLKLELAINLTNNPEKASAFVQKQPKLEYNKSDEYYRKNLSDTLVSVGGKYVDITSKEYQNQKISDEDRTMMRNKGYVLLDELPKDTDPPLDFIKYKNLKWYKID